MKSHLEIERNRAIGGDPRGSGRITPWRYSMSEIIGCYSRGIARALGMRFEGDSEFPCMACTRSGPPGGKAKHAFIRSILIGVWLQL